AYTDRVDGGAFNRVAEGDLHLVWKRQYFVDLQAATSFDRAASGAKTVTAPLWYAAFDCTGLFFGCRYGLTAIHRSFRAANGFVNRTGFVDATGITRFTLIQGKPGARIEKFNLRLTTDLFWNYEEFNPTDVPRETHAVFTAPANLRGGWI